MLEVRKNELKSFLCYPLAHLVVVTAYHGYISKDVKVTTILWYVSEIHNICSIAFLLFLSSLV